MGQAVRGVNATQSRRVDLLWSRHPTTVSWKPA